MMKRLLFCALSALFAFSASAVVKDDYVYTPQGRFLITGETNLMGNAGSFANLDGWEVVTAAEHVLADNYTVGLDTATQIRYAQSVVNTVGEGMKYTNSNLDGNATYVISYKMRNAAEAAPTKPLTTATNATHAGAGNLVVIAGADTVVYNKPAEISSDWVTYSYAVEGDGVARAFSISLTAMNTDVQIADIQILTAQKVADDRDAKAKADYIMSLWKLTDWGKYYDEAKEIDPAEDLITAYGQVATITDDMRSYLSEYLSPEEIAEYCPGFKEDLDTYNRQLSTYNEKYNNFMKTQMTAYIDVTAETGEHLGQNSGNNQKINPIGTWTAVFNDNDKTDRGYWRYGWVDLGHYAGSTNFTSAELRKEFELFEGGYTFKADFVGVSRPTTSSSDWNTNYGLTSDDAFVFVTDAEGNVIASSDTTGTATDIAGEWTTKYVSFTVPADGKYTMHMRTLRRYSTNGGQVYFRWPELYGKSFGQYSAEQKKYIAAVQEQITTGDNAYQVALDTLASKSFAWGNAALQACVDTMAAKKEKWDDMYNKEDEIVATYNPDTYVEGATKPESQMVYEVYSDYVKDLLAANKKIIAVNDTLKMLPAKIADAEKLNALTIYQVSTGKETLESEIAKAKDLYASMLATDYSEENAQAIRDEISALETAMTACKDGIPASKYGTVYADIDFDYEGEDPFVNVEGYTEEGAPATIKGKVGSLEVSSFKKVSEAGTSFPYELGIDADGGVKDYGNMLRVGGSDASVSFNASDLGNNILLISMDWWFSRLDNAYVGFEVCDEDGNRIAGVQPCQYNSSKVNYNTFEMNDRIGSFYAAINKDNKDLIFDDNHTQWTAVLDFANAKQYIIATLPSGTVFSDPVDMSVEGIPASFKITATGFKNYPGRRSWFDNLKIQKLEVSKSIIKGDVNGDGVVDVTDIQEVINFMLDDKYDEKADVNKDQVVDVTDVQEIINIMLQN